MCSYKHVFVICKRENYAVSVSELHDALLRRLSCVKKYIVRLHLSKNNLWLYIYTYFRESYTYRFCFLTAPNVILFCLFTYN